MDISYYKQQGSIIEQIERSAIADNRSDRRLDLRNILYIIARNGGRVIVQASDYGDDTYIVFSSADHFSPDDENANPTQTFGFVQVLMDGYLAELQEGLSLKTAMRYFSDGIETEVFV